jgi:DtxR family Mn-dependent transcriptional regulator
VVQSGDSSTATPTARRYLRAILTLDEVRASHPFLMSDIAAELGISGSAVTSMLKKLADARLIDYQPHRSVQLTASGRQIAGAELRRVRLLKSFLMTILDISSNEIDADAERLSEVVSDRLVCRIDDFLNHPLHDPHGDPIPRIDGSIAESAEVPLASLPEATAFRVVRVLRRDPEFIDWLTEMGLGIGSSGIVLAQLSNAGVTRLRITGNELEIGRSAGESVLAVFHRLTDNSVGSPDKPIHSFDESKTSPSVEE